MRNNAKRLVSLLLAVALVFSLSLTAFAEEEEPLLSLETTPVGVHQGSEVTVTVNAAVDGVVADGKLTFHYDSEALEFTGAQAGESWPETADLSLQVNGGKEDAVIAAFAGAEAAGAGTILTLKFVALVEGQSKVTVDEDNSYVTGAEDYSLAAGTEITAQCPASRFTDVNLDAYYHEGLDYVLWNGYMVGMSGTEFGPNLEATRGMMVTILYRMAGSPEVTGTTPFTDVKEGKYYSDAVLWAYQQGIAKGMTEELFVPGRPVNREQMVTFFARYARYCGIETNAEGDLMDFADAEQVSAYAVESMTWAVENGLILGMSATVLNPKGNSTRGQMATVIYRFGTIFSV